MILKLIQRLVSGGPFYVRIRPQMLSVRDINAKRTIEDIPLMAITRGKNRSILAIGASAATEASTSRKEYELINGFDHPRSIISDFTVAEKTLQYFFRKLVRNKMLRPSPIVVMHVLDKMEGGLTQVEVRALQELAAGAGAREAYVWTGRELMDHEFESKQFPGNHWFPEQPKWAKT